ncbi:MAG TPA: MgtC/SapB family protein [Gemmatimonadaceae bacterium]|jgi:putative Mg2+ transporter-C (MgtC) family protein|nr:MgtC/SapB family protein [Gemmatimonadaceae bacterium]
MQALMGALEVGLLAKLLVAVLLGGAIGLEREVAGKPAGLRTNILICVGAALFMHLSIAVAEVGYATTGAPYGDTTRIAAQIVTGVGFLGAGTIMQARGTIIGLTSAATIWVVAAIGSAVGAGFFVAGLGAGALVMVVLTGLTPLERWVRRMRRVVSATVRARPGTDLNEVATVLHAAGIRIVGHQVFDHAEDRTFELKLSGPARQYEVVHDMLLKRDDVYGVHLD